MAKSTKKKFLSFLNLLILFVLFCCLSGCGNKEDKITPTTGSGRADHRIHRVIDVPGSRTDQYSYRCGTDSLGTHVSGAAVTFTILSNNSGGNHHPPEWRKNRCRRTGFSSLHGRSNQPHRRCPGYDPGQRRRRTGVVIITRISTSTASPGHRMTLTAAATSLAAGESSIITATSLMDRAIPPVGRS